MKESLIDVVKIVKNQYGLIMTSSQFGGGDEFFRVNFGGLHQRMVDGVCMDHLSFRRWARWVTQRIKDGKLYLAILELISGLLWHLRCLSSQRFSASMMIASVAFTAKPCVLFLNME